MVTDVAGGVEVAVVSDVYQIDSLVDAPSYLEGQPNDHDPYVELGWYEGYPLPFAVGAIYLVAPAFRSKPPER